MATVEEIERRVEQADAARSIRRSAAARCIGELADLRAKAAEKLSDIERELGDVLAEFSDVIGIEELAEFTEVPAAHLHQWLNNRKTTRPKRKRATAKADTGQALSAAETPPAGQTPSLPDVAMPRAAADQAARTPEPVT